MSHDLYTEWLGVPPGQRPPNHYALLGLPLFTNCNRAIEAAAQAQMDKLDQHAIHPDRQKRDTANRMMNAVAAARLELTDEKRRADYDRKLAERLGLEPPRPDSSALADTVYAGPVATPLDIAAPPPDQEHDPAAAELPDELFHQQPTLEQLDPRYAPPAAARPSGIPFGAVVAVAAAAAALVIAAIIIALVVMAGGERKPPPANGAAQVVTEQNDPTPAQPTRDTIRDEFDADYLHPAYTVSDPDRAALQDGRLVLDPRKDSPVSVRLQPRDDTTLFDEARITAEMEAGCELVFGIRTAAHLTVKRTENGLTVRARPGRPADPADNWPTLDDAHTLDLALVRERGSVHWSVNGRRVATSPDMSVRGSPAIEFTAHAPRPARIRIDHLAVSYNR